MRNSFAAILLATAAFGFSGIVQAEDRYSVNDVVKFYQQSADLGASRGICIGCFDQAAWWSRRMRVDTACGRRRDDSACRRSIA